jgi:YesN/AraC family two-component response regulator
MPKILVVDDEEDQEEIITQRFARKDYLREYEFLFARDGLAALKLIKEHADIDLALIDINMPEMDGLTLLQKIKETNPVMRSIMLSAYGDMSNIRTAMNCGAFDFLNKPIDMTDLGITIKKTIEEVKRIKEAARMQHENITLKQKSSELEMQALRAQMSPHFIFNSLNSINMFILENNRLQASEYLSKFSKLIRLILQNSQETLIPLEKELEALQLYMELESLRFENKFTYKINVTDDIDTATINVPPLIIQPYVENAIWHGLMHKKESGNLEVTVHVKDKTLYYKITDDGIGRQKAEELKSKSAVKQKSMGMRITADRIALLKQHSQTSIIITDLVLKNGNVAGTEVLIEIPVVND